MILKKLDRILRTDVKYLLKGGSWLAISQGIVMVATFGLSIAMANLVSPSVYGIYKFVTSLSNAIYSLTLTGVGSAITQAVSRGYEGSLKEGFRENLMWSTGAFLICFVVGFYYIYQDNNAIGWSMLIIGASLPLINSGKLYGAFLDGKKNFKAKAFFHVLVNTIPIFALILALFYSDNVLTLVAVYFGTYLVSAILFYVITILKYRPNADVDHRTKTYSKHLSFMNVFGKVVSHIDNVLVFQFTDAAQLAVYAIAKAPVWQLKTIDQIFSRLALPKLGQRKLKELQLSLPRKVFILSLAMLVIAIIYSAMAPLLFNLLFPNYIEAVKYSQFLSFTLVTTPGIMLFTNALVSHMQTKRLYFIKLIVPTTRIITIFALLPFFGIWGVIVSTYITNFTNLAIITWLFKRR